MHRLPVGKAVDSISLHGTARSVVQDFIMLRKLSLALLVITAGVSSAQASCVQAAWFGSVCSPVQAPEIDPSSAISGLTLLAGGLTILRARQRKTTK